MFGTTKNTTFINSNIFYHSKVVYVGLKKDFSIHKQKTIESFGFVKADISSINYNIENIKNALASIGSRISTLDNEILGLRKSVDTCVLDISIQQNNSLNMQSRMNGIGKSMSGAMETLTSIKDRINTVFNQNKSISKTMTGYGTLIKSLTSKANAQSINSKKLSTQIRKYEQEIKKVKNLINNKIKTVKNADLELDRKIISQRKRIAQLNRKIESKKAVKRIRRKAKKMMPRKKVTTIKTPKKTVIKTETPRKKKIVEVFNQGRKPLL